MARDKWVGFGFQENEHGETRNTIRVIEKKEKIKRERYKVSEA